MTVDDLLKLEKPEEYDFTEDWGNSPKQEALDEYNALRPWKKYFVYKFSNLNKKPDAVYEKALEFWENEGKKYTGYISDPDTYSELLQEIYKELWDKDVLEVCSKKCEKIHGDTMNSIATTMSRYIKYVYSEKYYNSKNRESWGKGFINEKGNPYSGSLNQSLEIFCREEYFKDGFNGENELSVNFLKANHTLGNFIPVPYEKNGGLFNSPRKASTNDYWDLTLYYIYKWYKKTEDKTVETIMNDYLCDCNMYETNLCKLLGRNCANVKLCIEWLCQFHTEDNKPSWNSFIEKNFLQPFVEIVEEEKDSKTQYGMPLMLWINKNDKPEEQQEKLWEKRIKNNKPLSKEDCEMFFENATKNIKERTQLMLEKLKEKQRS